MDTITALLQLPVSTLLILAGFVIVFFALFEVNKGSVKLRTGLTKNSFVPVGIGALMILGGVYLYINAATPQQPTSGSIVISPAIAASETVAPTETPVVPTETVSPTDTPITPTETATQPPIKTIADGCIAVQTWEVRSSDTNLLNSISKQDNCWNLNSLGLTVESGGNLHLVVSIPKAQVTAGIFTPIADRSIIKFKVLVKNLYLAYSAKPATLSFAIAPQDDPMAAIGSGRFKLQIEDTKSPSQIYFMLADSTETTGIRSKRASYKRSYDVRMELKGLTMQVYVDGVKLMEDITIPSGPKVFTIGYSVPLSAYADIEIKDIVIDEINK